MNKLKFIIYTYDYDHGIGGIKVMHKLCHIINELGYECYLYPIYMRNEFFTYYDNTPIITYEIIENLDNCVVIYPEGISGNPLNAKNVVRWILGPIDINSYKTYKNSDLIFYYMKYYQVDNENDDILFIPEFHSDIFYDNNNGVRNGSCFAVRKCKDPKFIHPINSVEISWTGAGKLSNLADLFRSKELFYCYDNYTFLYTQAAMCGCIPIVIPDGNKTKEEWINGSELHKYGVAYGIDEIEHAKNTRHLLLELIKDEKIKAIKNVITFIDKCHLRLKK